MREIGEIDETEEEWDEPLDLFDEEEEEEVAPIALPSFAQMEEDCAWAAEVIERRLAEDPNYPTEALLAEVRSRVRPLSGYRATESELRGMRILAMKARVSDRLRELEKEEENKEEGT